MWNTIKLLNPVWYIDATGGVHQKINVQKEIFTYRTVCHDENQKKIIPDFDFLTTCHTSENLAKYLRYAVARIEQNFSKNSPLIVPPIIVMDICKVHLQCTLVLRGALISIMLLVRKCI